MRLTGLHHALQMREFAAFRFRDLIGPADIATTVGLNPAYAFLFYCGFVDIQRRGIARRAGAAAICNQPAQLFGAAPHSIGR